MRKRLADIFRWVERNGERIVVTLDTGERAAVVPVEDLRRLEAPDAPRAARRPPEGGMESGADGQT